VEMLIISNVMVMFNTIYAVAPLDMLENVGGEIDVTFDFRQCPITNIGTLRPR